MSAMLIRGGFKETSFPTIMHPKIQEKGKNLASIHRFSGVLETATANGVADLHHHNQAWSLFHGIVMHRNSIIVKRLNFLTLSRLMFRHNADPD